MLGSMFVTIGSAMIYTLEPNSGSGKYIGYQVLASIGSGLIIQLKVIVAQAISKRVDMSVTVGSVLCESCCAPSSFAVSGHTD